MEPQDPKDVTRDTVLDLSGLVVAVGLGYSGGVHSVFPHFLWAGPRGYQHLRGHSSVVMGAKRPREATWRPRTCGTVASTKVHKHPTSENTDHLERG